jgi:hypothetical protein
MRLGRGCRLMRLGRGRGLVRLGRGCGLVRLRRERGLMKARGGFKNSGFMVDGYPVVVEELSAPILIDSEVESLGEILLRRNVHRKG